MNNEEKILAMLEAMQSDIVGVKSDMVGVKEKLGELDERSQRTAILLETEVDRKLNLLYEGHGIIMESLDQLASKDRVEALESDVALLKDAVKLMRQEIAELKKAQ